MSKYVNADEQERIMLENEMIESNDWVEVVRCKDCIHAEVGEKDVWCEYYESYKKKDGYCDFGERKESKIKKCFDIPKEIAEMLLEDTERKETDDR